ncbi:uncharacterized protein J7T54_004423 [Emericellopsis cladophorae]|uniref:Uncharacterized protein n=1 Tax=Emericellopsis cladophorae TaxID=2686198 RepID=A0A9Q0BFX9_9HYPO|nr:uncharacterized protein J7T54_004423 [Emericellopsis cladophorae]KAI6783396.1 hypothetical protein J7T54_004423 [Emericellopsis cladophorae]
MASLVFGATIEARQQDGQVYCDSRDDELNVDDCRGAAEMINTGSGYYKQIAQFRYGNCIIDIVNRIGFSGSIEGQLYKDSIMEVTVYRCELCAYGVCATCDDPGQGPLKRDVADMGLEPSSELNKRQDSPEPGLSCGGWNPAVHADNCRDAANEIEAQDGYIALPFREVVAGCTIAVEQKKPDLAILRSGLADILRHGTDLCDNQGWIGMISDTRNSLVDVFYGKICGSEHTHVSQNKETFDNIIGLRSPRGKTAPVTGGSRGKTAPVTGGSRGIGLEVVHGLLEADASVGFTYSATTPDEIAALTKAPSSENGGRLVKAYRCNVTDRASVHAVTQQAATDLGDGGLDIVVANAGIADHVATEDCPEDKFHQMMDVNMEKRGGPLLLDRASDGPRHEGTQQDARRQHHLHGQRQRSTEMLDVHPKAWRDKWFSMIPGARLCSAPELKGSHVYLASDASSYMMKGEPGCGWGIRVNMKLHIGGPGHVRNATPISFNLASQTPAGWGYTS